MIAWRIRFSRCVPQGLAAVTLLLTALPAHAYIDPGTGTMVLQVIGAAIAGALYYFREIRRKVRSWFSVHRNSTDTTQAGETKHQ